MTYVSLERRTELLRVINFSKRDDITYIKLIGCVHVMKNSFHEYEGV